MSEKKLILVETSARHVHVTDKDLEILFGKGHTLTKKKELSQPGQFACEERLDVVGPKNTIKNISILGPTRKSTQVEVSFTDARTLGVTAPIRESGHISASAPCKLVGSAGEIEIPEGVIIAKRHIHMTPKDAEEYGVTDKQIVCVRINSERPVILCDTVIRVNKNFAPAMHIDTDESNAAAAFGVIYGEIIK
ncbi:MAG: propanediol utilization protein [Clostridiales bacterium GWF2_38_85]|nr:MAG: propanediol utilization protein [Clostridiales bacterium GWF2_38_85]